MSKKPAKMIKESKSDDELIHEMIANRRRQMEALVKIITSIDPPLVGKSKMKS